MQTVNETDIKFRLAKLKDIHEVIELEARHGEGIWNADDLRHALLAEQAFVMWVAVQDERVVGVLMYELHKKRIDVITLLVRKDFRRLKIGTRLARRLLSALELTQKIKAVCEVRESSLEAQLFLRKIGFKATKILRGWYLDHVPGKGRTVEDAYRFKYEELVE